MDIVLVVNDNPRNLILATTQFLLMNQQVATASLKKNALELARLLQPKLIVLDLVLADGHGLELAEELKQIADLRDIPIIVITTHSQPEMQARALAIGVNEFIAKPYDPALLRELAGRYVVSPPVSRSSPT